MYLFGSVGLGDVRAAIIVSAALVVLFGMMWVLLSNSFLQIATSTGKVARREYRETHSRQRSIDIALLSREFSRFTASPNYMLNCGLGTFLMSLCAIAVLWKGGDLFAVLDAMFVESADSVPLLLCVVLCGLASMNFMTAPSVSLEGKSLWLLQSLPVEPWSIFSGKNQDAASFNRFAIASVYHVYGSSLSPSFATTAADFSFASSYVLLMALVGLLLGIKMPTLTWTNEIMPIKQGAPVVLTLFGGFGYMVLLFVGFMLLPGWILGFCGYMSCFVGTNLFLSVWVYLWLRKKKRCCPFFDAVMVKR